jgi:hypothetical protein
MARWAREIRQLELDLSALSALERLPCLGEVAIALAETMAESRHYAIGSTTVSEFGSMKSFALGVGAAALMLAASKRNITGSAELATALIDAIGTCVSRG